MSKPEFLLSGEAARLFPVLANTSKEGRTTSIVLACMSHIHEFGAELMSTVGRSVGKRSEVTCYTEVVFKADDKSLKDRPDGLIVVRTGGKEWRALVEAKVGNSELNEAQIERYRNLAKDNKIDCVITISNQFATNPEKHPIAAVLKSRSKVPVYHWSWMFILTTADLLISNESVMDRDQALLLVELRRFLTHESAGVRGFDRMPAEWSELNKLVSAGGTIPARSTDAIAVLEAWHQETKDLSLILSRQTETSVTEKLARKHRSDPGARLRDEFAYLREKQQLTCSLEVPNAAAPLDIVADIPRRTIEVGMSLRAPEDRKSSRARVNWLLRQIRSDKLDDLYIRFKWPGRSEDTLFPYKDVLSNPAICEEGKGDLQVISFQICYSKRIGGRFAQQMNFISDLEAIVPDFYREIGQNLSAWRKSAPKIRDDRATAEEVTVDAMQKEGSEEASDALD